MAKRHITCLAKLFGCYPYPAFSFQSRAILLWQTPSIEVIRWSVGENLFEVRFARVEDKDRVLGGGPYLIMGRLLSVRIWNPTINPSTVDFSTEIFEMILHHLRPEHRSLASLLDLASRAGSIVGLIHDPLLPPDQKRVRLKVNLERPLIFGASAFRQDKPEACYIVFEYVDLPPRFSEKCETINHDEFLCGELDQGDGVYPL